MSVITYAKAGGPPSYWRALEVFDGDEKLGGVLEVDTEKGFAILRNRGRVSTLESKRLRIEPRQ